MRAHFFSDRILFLSYLCAMLMVGVEVSIGTAAFTCAIVFWRYGAERWSWPLLNRKITGVLSILVLVQVLIEFKTLIGQEPSYAFLLALSALRMMEYDGDRDRKFIILLGFVLLAVKALFTIDVYWIVPTAISFLGLWSSLLSRAIKNKSRYLTRLGLTAAPLAILLFFAFPRVVVPWAMGRGNPQGEIGFTDEISPGSVSGLAGSEKVAFRARFIGGPQSVSDLYWKGAVLNRSLGLAWKPHRQLFLPQAHLAESGTDTFYEVAIEATAKRYLFALDNTEFIAAQENRVYKSEDGEYRTQRPINKASAYRGFFGTKAAERELEKQELGTPKLTGETLRWVNEEKNKNLTAKEYLDRLQAFFSNPGFAYTLNPGTYGEDSLNEFLFKRRQGFCEHFAGAYATLARALGVPARVVVGYHGGLYNAWGDFWRVSQKDAHAWAEVFESGKWQRVDPTAWVAPLRLRIGAEDFFNLSETDRQSFARSPDWQPIKQQDYWFQNIGFWMESLNYEWTYFLMEFDLQAQSEILAWIKDSKWLVALALFLSAIGFFIIKALRARRQGGPQSERLLRKVENWGALKAVPRKVSETPLQYFGRLSSQFKDPVFSEIAQLYEAVVYEKSIELKGPLIRKLLSQVRKN